MHTIEITLAVTDAQGATTQLNAIFEDTLARWPELHAEFAKFSEAVHKTVFHDNGPVLARLQQDFPEDYQSGFAAPQVATSKFENVDPEALNLMSGGTLARDYGVANMTPGEVQRLLESKDRDLDELRAQNIAVQQTNAALNQRNAELAEKLRIFEDGSPGVADLRERYNELMQQTWDGADEDTKLQDERDIARKERDRAIRDRDDALVVVTDLKEQVETFQKQASDARNKISELDRKLLEAVAARSAADKQVNQLKDSATKRVEKHVEQLEAAEKRYQELKSEAEKQAEAIGKALVEAVQTAKQYVMAAESQPDPWLIHKNDVNAYIDGILKRVAPEAIPTGPKGDAGEVPAPPSF